jgi:hypothetical protein
MNMPDDGRRWRRQSTDNNIVIWVLAALGAVILLGVLSWNTSEKIESAQDKAQAPIERKLDEQSSTGSSSGEAGKNSP